MISALQAELDSSIQINVGGKRKRMTVRQVIAKAITQKAMKGDSRAIAEVNKVDDKVAAKAVDKQPVRFTLKLSESSGPPWLRGSGEPEKDDPTF